jgi:NAD-dependent SIR2 family protein deacetylase
MFDILYFEHDPRPFFKFAKEIYPGQFRPSLSHRFIKKLELKSKLLRNYTQNIDTLENAAQINNVIQCHGSFATATCTTCKYKVDCELTITTTTKINFFKNPTSADELIIFYFSKVTISKIAFLSKKFHTVINAIAIAIAVTRRRRKLIMRTRFRMN